MESNKKQISLNKKEKEAIKEFFKEKNLPLNVSLTFEDVALPDKYSDVRSRSEINDFKSDFIPGELKLNIPFISANMESVSGSEMIVAMEREGGLGILPQTLPTEGKLEVLERVRRSDCAKIEDPITTTPDATLDEAKSKMSNYNIKTLIVVEDEKPVGILSNRDWFYEENGKKVKELMTSENIITAPENIEFNKAKDILKKNKIEKLPLVDDSGKLVGLITAHGLFYEKHYPKALRDERGQFIRIGAVGVGKHFTDNHMRDVKKQYDAGIRALLIDTARANSVNTKDAVENIKNEFPDLPLIVGNVSTPEGAKFLFELGVDVVKVGVGPGHACTTRKTGVGIPQLTAVAKCSALASTYKNKTIIADGGISSAGDAVKALIAGADALMMGYILAGTKESRALSYSMHIKELGADITVKDYEGSASFEAQKRRKDRKDLESIRRPEGIKKQVPVMGSVEEKLNELLDGMRSSMSYLGARNIEELKEKGVFVPQTSSGLSEGIDVYD